MRDAGEFVVRARAAESFVVDRLAGRAFHQVRAAESHERRALDHHDHVGQRGQVCAAGDARPHHRRDLRNLQIAPHDRVVIEDSRRAILAGKHAALIRKIHAGRIDQIDDRHVRAHRDLLRAQNLLDRLRPPRPAFTVASLATTTTSADPRHVDPTTVNHSRARRCRRRIDRKRRAIRSPARTNPCRAAVRCVRAR